jgi:hypothetical protein
MPTDYGLMQTGGGEGGRPDLSSERGYKITNPQLSK